MSPASTLLALLVLAAAPATATTVPPPPPHHPERAGCTIAALVQLIDRRDAAAFPPELKIYTDRLGQVATEELEAFFGEFAARGSRWRSAPLRVNNWGVLRVNGVSPLYVISVQRGAGDGSHWSAWLVQFQSDDIRSLRRADELWPFADGTHFHSTTDCGSGRSDG